MVRFARLALAGLATAILIAAGAAPVSADYGNHGGNVQLYQATASMSCNNPDLCAGLGGFWAWGEFNADGTFSAEVTFCSHLQGPGGPTGAGHEHADGRYAIIDFGQGPWIVIVSETDTLTGQGNGTVIVNTNEFQPVGPAMKAHLSTAQLLGFSAPGVTFQVTVTPMHT